MCFAACGKTGDPSGVTIPASDARIKRQSQLDGNKRPAGSSPRHKSTIEFISL
jgi:hypothetical protein